MAGGRPSDYTPELADEICRRVALGENLNRISQDDSMPCQDTIYEWRKKIEEFSDKYQGARESRADARSDRIDDYVRDVISGKLEPNAANVIISAEKWQAGRECPKKYGDKTAIVGGGEGDSPVSVASAGGEVPLEIKNALAFIIDKLKDQK